MSTFTSWKFPCAPTSLGLTLGLTALLSACDSSSQVATIGLQIKVLNNSSDGSSRALPSSGTMEIIPYDVHAKAIMPTVSYDLSTGKGALPELPIGRWRFMVKGTSPQFDFFGSSGEFEVSDNEARYVQAIVGEKNCAGSLPDLPAPTGHPKAADASYDLSTGRVGAAVAELPDGRLLITGGATIDGAGNTTSVNDQVFVFEPSYGFIFPTDIKLSTPRAFHQATALDDGRVLITGGVTTVLDSMEQPTVSAELIEVGADGELIVTNNSALQVNLPRSRHAAQKLKDGTVLIVGGRGADGAPLKDVTRFFPDSNTFRVQDEMSTARVFHAVAPINQRSNDFAVITGGLTDAASASAAATNKVEIFTVHPDTCGPEAPVKGCFISGPSLSRPRWGHVALSTTAQDNTVIIVGGFSEGTSSQPTAFASEIEAFSIKDARPVITKIGALSSPRGYLSGARLLNDSLMLVGGQDLAGNSLDTVSTLQVSLVGSDLSPSINTRCPLSQARVSPAVVVTQEGGAVILGGVRKGATQLESGRLDLFYPAITSEQVFER